MPTDMFLCCCGKGTQAQSHVTLNQPEGQQEENDNQPIPMGADPIKAVSWYQGDM